MKHSRITANTAAQSLTVYAGGVTASATSRTLGGDVVLYGVPGRTSAGLLRVRAGALRFPDDLTRVKLTKEHNRDESRGYLQAVQHFPDRIRASLKVSDGQLGDAALTEAKDKTRDGFSFDIVDAVIEGDELVDGLVVAIGQVGIPAYDNTRIDTIAASQISNATTNNGGTMLTEAQKKRLAELAALTNLTPEQQTELAQLNVLNGTPAADPAATSDPAGSAPAAAPAAAAAAEPQQVAAAMAPAGVPAPVGGSTPTGVQVVESEFQRLVGSITASLRGDQSSEVQAALADVTHAQHTANVSPTSWSGELWSGVEYTPQFLDLFNTGTLDAWEGKGWRWGTKPHVGDYAGNKADIPTNTPTTVPASWSAFRIAGGWDIDRKFFDFPDQAFIASFIRAVGEDIALKRDLKVRDYIVAQAVDTGLAAQTSLLKAVRLALKIVKRNTRQQGSFVLVNDDDYDDLFDVTALDVPAFLGLLGVDPSAIRATPDLASGEVIAGVKQAATVRWLGGASPIRVEAQNLTKAGIDEAFFTYGAIEEHHETGIVKQTYTPA